MDLKKVKRIIDNLRKKYPVFVSEKHLQVAFSIEVEKYKYKSYPEYSFDNELLKKNSQNKKYIDLVIGKGKKKFAFEFKYPVCGFEGDINGMHIKLRHQSAWPGRRYDCLKDIERLETLKEKGKINSGYFILITNYKGFWESGKTGNNIKDKAFRFEKGIKKGTKRWSNDTGGMKKGREKNITIKNNYKVEFETFSNNDKGSGNIEFKVLVLKI